MTSDIIKYAGIIKSIDDLERVARAMAASGFFSDTRQAAQAIVKLMAGYELGFGPFASMTGVHILPGGRVAVGANLMAAAIKRSGKYDYRIRRLDDQACEIEILQGDQVIGVSQFNTDDARAAGLLEKDNWRKYPRNMLFARAISNAVRWYAPDVFGGATVYAPDELDLAVDEDGNPITEGEAQDVQSMPYELAMDYRTPKGARLGDLSNEQLQYILSSQAYPEHIRVAARTILEHRIQDGDKDMTNVTQET
jgi:hypothetical protein